ncbi:MAG: DUF1670 domain-containing protein [Nitrospiraceae bacterium]|nr:DUF1670 domain-containing protein [Nitrospiraceae bacterium]
MEFGKVEYICAGQKKGGRPETRALILTLVEQGDEALLRKMGIRALRLKRIARLTSEAHGQGRLLGYEDLSNLLMTSLATLKRDVAYLEAHGATVMIRGRRNGRKAPESPATFCRVAEEVGA